MLIKISFDVGESGSGLYPRASGILTITDNTNWTYNMVFKREIEQNQVTIDLSEYSEIEIKSVQIRKFGVMDNALNFKRIDDIVIDLTDK